jgi:hypothetical protein
MLNFNKQQTVDKSFRTIDVALHNITNKRVIHIGYSGKELFFQKKAKLSSVVITGFTSGEEVTRPLDLNAFHLLKTRN